MSTTTATSAETIQEYFKALSGKAKTNELIDRFVDDPALKQHIASKRSQLSRIRIQVHQMVSEGDMVAVNSTFKGTHKGTFAGIEPTGKTISPER